MTHVLDEEEQLEPERFYTIQAPGTIRSNGKYTVAVTLFQADASCAINVSLAGADYQEQKLLDVSPKSTEMLVFEVPKLERSEYFLEVCGTGSFNFKERIQLKFAEQIPLVYIQLDKQGYKRGDKMNFRVLFLDSNVKPLQIELPIRILIQQNEENVVEFSNVDLVSGMYSGQWAIGDDAPFGIYIIDVRIGEDGIANKTFEIIEYEEPKFNIEINTPAEVNYEDHFIKVSIEATYADGAPVNGRCIVSLRSIGGYVGLAAKSIEKCTDIDGIVGDIIFDIENDLCITNEFLSMSYLRTASLAVDVAVIAEAEGAREARTKIVTITKQTPSGVEENCERVSCGWSTCMLNSSDLRSNKSVVLSMRNDKPKIGEIINCDVLLKKPTKYFVYFVIARGNIIHSKFVSLEDDDDVEQSEYVISLEAIFQLVPRAFILAYFVYKGELFFDEIAFSLQHDFENQLEITAPSSADVGDEIELQIRTSPNSFVALMAVDIRTVHSLSENNVRFEDIFHALSQIRSQTPWLDGYGEYPGLVSGLVTFTNATWTGFIKGDPNGWNQRLFDREHMDNTKNGYCIDVNREKKEVQRKIQQLNQPLGNWIFCDRVSGDDGSLAVIERLPQNATTWLLTAISINPDTGFTMTKKPIEIKAMPNPEVLTLESTDDTDVDVAKLLSKTIYFEVDLYEEREFSNSYEIDILPNCELLTTELSIHGNLLGPTLANLSDYAGIINYRGMLNMSAVLPNVVILEFLQSQDQLDSELAKDFIEKLKEAVERELAAVFDDDGSLPWTKCADSSCLYVTALIMATFQRASKFIDIDAEIIKSGLDYLASLQVDCGGFINEYNYKKELGIGMTALVLLAFLQNEETVLNYGNTVDRAFEYILSNWTATKSHYDLALVFNAMQLAKHPAADALKERLLSCSSTEPNSNKMWWSCDEVDLKLNPSLRVDDVELTAQVLLGLLETEPAESLLPVIKWLVPIGRKFGDGIVMKESASRSVGLNALLKFAVKSGSCAGATTMEYVADIFTDEGRASSENKHQYTGSILIEPQTAMMTKTHMMPKNTRRVTIATVDKGTFLGSLTSRYRQI